jgi:hypothetical protein
MTPKFANQHGGIALILLLLITVGLVAVPVILHFAQKTHNQLPLEIDEAFPPGQPFVSGEIFGTTLKTIVEHELDSRTGWRPNDFFLWGPYVMADNNASRQLGIILAVRESARVMKDHLTKVSSDEYDDNLLQADNLFRNDPTKFWFPSAEGRYRKGAEHLQAYLDGLKTEPPTSKPMNHRNVEAIRLFQAYTDLLGNAHANLFKTEEADGSPIRPWRNDDYFYEAQGMAHVMYHLTMAIQREYHQELDSRPTIKQIMDEVSTALGNAALLKPLVILDGSAASLVANHRKNLQVFVDEARQKMYSIREELEK